MNVAVNCDDALLLEKVPPVCSERTTSCRSKCEEGGESERRGRLHQFKPCEKVGRACRVFYIG